MPRQIKSLLSLRSLLSLQSLHLPYSGERKKRGHSNPIARVPVRRGSAQHVLCNMRQKIPLANDSKPSYTCRTLQKTLNVE
jgi:hypothetical protein